ncbi:hypothetical protein [Paenibacillus protaetiae]|uniref:Sporulation membrane protein YtrI C-terminal domain-containing protein n=1 Tax=Paenibacillus protaetiae TaxID=2509456 RepID=A0A4P6EWZ1_9BACL|nr:hypothetical protein [Paenibacillus protaetiae]QAY65107.1 hypothetical protein ET464_00595 [Paenibacillus protaetiae]
MRIPPFHRLGRLVQSAGIFICGAVIGAVVYNTLFQAKFESVVNLKLELESKLAQYELDLKKYDQLNTKYTVIKSVQPRIEEDAGADGKIMKLDKLTETELIKRVKQDLSVFIGRSIYEVDSDSRFARKLLEKKIYYNIMGKDYTVEAKTLLVAGNVLQVWIQVHPYERPPA